ncbi:Cyclin-like protein [Venustampulla echinocandica]|uniref:Cyclin-like protein n=1 Tax=Venustampulla echinocandica TaxID=2656787 RepID=A0A370TCP7_9HELO|nr:Cyclin-like protein [Venustampulla echinocandica]RDL32001.1 Cyclin-like protein [Venustampulla echinocandica]
MDARPQRPVRPLRLPGDENTAPTANQTLHQRHKSSGTLSNMATMGGLKAAAKRTAFGDVSNTAKSLSIRDDTALACQSLKADIVKPLALPEKPVARVRPAQRPLGAAPLKGPLDIQPSAPHQSALVPASKAPLPDSQPQSLYLPATKRTQSKNSTTIYKDDSAENDVQSRSASISIADHPSVSTAPIRQTLEPRHHKSQPQLKTEQPVLRRTQSKYQEKPSDILESIIPADPIYEDAREEQGMTSNEAYETYLRMVEQRAEEEPVKPASKCTDDAVDRLQRQLPAAPQISEPEEYWEDEDEEIYDEQGYATAHSYKSRGDNTTGGATTVLFPKVTNKSKKEIAVAKEIVESARTIEEIEDEAWDTSMVAEYGDEIFAYMRELEMRMLPNAHYMDNQAEIQWSMRSVLMDWLIQVHHRFSLLPETLFLCVNYIDRFLSCKIVSLGKLQLVGATAIFVAAKYEEINCPSVNEIVYMVDKGYTVDEILKAERFMLSMLQFELGWPGPMSFLRRISKADDYDLETRTLAKYFLEVTIMDERFVGSPPSYIAAGAHCFARFMLKKGDWSSAHVYYSGYTWTQLRPLISMMLECCENPQKHHGAVFDKYSDRRYKRASLYVQGEMARGFVLPSIQLPHARPSLPSLEDVAARMPFETHEPFKRVVQVKA